MRAAARTASVPEPPPYAEVYPRSPATISVAKLGIPVTVALAVGWAIGQLVFGAGGKLGGAEKDAAYTTARLDGVVSGLAENNARAARDHDEIIELKVKIASLAEQEAGKNVTVKIEDPKGKQ